MQFLRTAFWVLCYLGIALPSSYAENEEAEILSIIRRGVKVSLPHITNVLRKIEDGKLAEASVTVFTGSRKFRIELQENWNDLGICKLSVKELDPFSQRVGPFLSMFDTQCNGVVVTGYYADTYDLRVNMKPLRGQASADYPPINPQYQLYWQQNASEIYPMILRALRRPRGVTIGRE